MYKYACISCHVRASHMHNVHTKHTLGGTASTASPVSPTGLPWMYPDKHPWPIRKPSRPLHKSWVCPLTCMPLVQLKPSGRPNHQVGTMIMVVIMMVTLLPVLADMVLMPSQR